MLKVIQEFIERLEDRRNPSIERRFKKLQENADMFRQAVAQTIATEKQLEQQLEKNQKQAQVWESRYQSETESIDARAQALMRKQQYESAANELSVQIQASKVVTGSFRMRLFDVERPVQLVWLVKSFLAVFPEDSKAPKELRDHLKELFCLIGQMITELPPTEVEVKKSDDFYPKMFDHLERTLNAFPTFSSYYLSHPKDPEADKFKARATGFYKELIKAIEQDREKQEVAPKFQASS